MDEEGIVVAGEGKQAVPCSTSARLEFRKLDKEGLPMPAEDKAPVLVAM